MSDLTRKGLKTVDNKVKREKHTKGLRYEVKGVERKKREGHWDRGRRGVLHY